MPRKKFPLRKIIKGFAKPREMELEGKSLEEFRDIQHWDLLSEYAHSCITDPSKYRNSLALIGQTPSLSVRYLGYEVGSVKPGGGGYYNFDPSEIMTIRDSQWSATIGLVSNVGHISIQDVGESALDRALLAGVEWAAAQARGRVAINTLRERKLYEKAFRIRDPEGSLFLGPFLQKLFPQSD